MRRDPFFRPFQDLADSVLNEEFKPYDPPHPLAIKAAEDLQIYLKEQNDWEHNFGLASGQSGKVIGKMFGVLVVRTARNELGYLAAFSGKLAGGNEHQRFVPPVFDGLSKQSFVNEGMRGLTRLNNTIKELEQGSDPGGDEIRLLKLQRRKYSHALQLRIFDHYFFLNQAGEKKSLNEIFRKAAYKNPPSGAGECAGPKLLHYAFQHKMKPIALTEFWWGLSPKSEHWKHRHYYPCCKEKCEPILNFMLEP